MWAGGNGGEDDDCGCDGYLSSIYTIGVGSINDHGHLVYYSESCPSLMAVVFTGGTTNNQDYAQAPFNVVRSK